MLSLERCPTVRAAANHTDLNRKIFNTIQLGAAAALASLITLVSGAGLPRRRPIQYDTPTIRASTAISARFLAIFKEHAPQRMEWRITGTNVVGALACLRR
jgi:hypothetical protein